MIIKYLDFEILFNNNIVILINRKRPSRRRNDRAAASSSKKNLKNTMWRVLLYNIHDAEHGVLQSFL